MLIANNVFTDWANSIFHTILLWLDGIVYKFIAICYNLFIFLATEPIFDEEFFSDFAKRIYAILGVFMLFYLAYALLNALVDPEKLSKGDKSVSKLAMNLVISLILLGLSPSIFNYAYRLQNYILSSNLLGAVILGTDTDSTDSVRTFGGELSFTVMNAFINPDNYNVNMSQDYYWEDRFKEDAMKKNNFDMLPGLASSIIKPTADYKGGENEGETVQVQYYPGVSTLAGIFMIYVILSFTIDLGVRIFKFAFCQLLAPIPIVMRAMPGKKAQFDKWLKLTITVYLEVFVRVGFMYLAVYFVKAIVDNVKFDELFSGGRLLGMMALVILIMGVFAFAKQAPKMLGDILGIDSGNLKLGIGEKLKAGGAFVGGAMVGAGITTGINNFTRGMGLSAAKLVNGDFKGSVGSFFRTFGSTAAGMASGARYGAQNGMKATNFSEMRNAAGRGSESAIDNRNRREQYRAGHGGFFGSMYGHMTENVSNLASWAGLDNIVDKVKFEDNFINQFDDYKSIYDNGKYQAIQAKINELEAAKAANENPEKYGVNNFDEAIRKAKANQRALRIEKLTEKDSNDNYKYKDMASYMIYNLSNQIQTNPALVSELGLDGHLSVEESKKITLQDGKVLYDGREMDMAKIEDILEHSGADGKGLFSDMFTAKDAKKVDSSSIAYKEYKRLQEEAKNKK